LANQIRKMKELRQNFESELIYNWSWQMINVLFIETSSQSKMNSNFYLIYLIILIYLLATKGMCYLKPLVKSNLVILVFQENLRKIQQA